MKKTIIGIIAGVMASLLATVGIATASAQMRADNAEPTGYTVVMKNNITDKVYEAEGIDDSEGKIAANFYSLPAGEYDVAVYTLNEQGGNTSLCGQTTWVAQACSDDAAYDVTASYEPQSADVDVHINWITSSSIDVAKLNSMYEVSFVNKETKEAFSTNALIDFDRSDAFVATVDGLSKGVYDVAVTSVNEQGGNSSVCARTEWTCTAAENEVCQVKLHYFTVPSEVQIAVQRVMQTEEEPYTIVMQNTATGETYQAQAKINYNRYDCDYAYIQNVPAGEYNIVCYTFNEQGGNTSLCAHTTCAIDLEPGQTANISVCFALVTSELEATVVSVN